MTLITAFAFMRPSSRFIYIYVGNTNPKEQFWLTAYSCAVSGDVAPTVFLYSHPYLDRTLYPVHHPPRHRSGQTAVQARLTHSSPRLRSGSGSSTNMEIAEGNFGVKQWAVTARSELMAQQWRKGEGGFL